MQSLPSEAVACTSCAACCCRLEVMLMGNDDVPSRFVRQDPWGGSVMHRLEDGWCAAVDRESMRCTIYARRPNVCRDFEVGSGECLVERRLLPAGAGSRQAQVVIPIVYRHENTGF